MHRLDRRRRPLEQLKALAAKLGVATASASGWRTIAGPSAAADISYAVRWDVRHRDAGSWAAAPRSLPAARPAAFIVDGATALVPIDDAPALTAAVAGCWTIRPQPA